MSRKLNWLWLVLLPLTALATDEQQLQTSVQFSKNSAVYQLSLNNASTITGNFAYDAVLAVPTNGVAVSFGAVLPVGTIILQNITTNAGATVKYGTNATAIFGILPPGTHAQFRSADFRTNLWLQGMTNAVFINNVRVFGVSQ